MRAVVAGLVGSYPLGGMAFHYLQYALGLKALGWEVAYLEDTGKWFYNPLSETFCADPTYNVDYLRGAMQAFGLPQSWCLRDGADRWHGPLADQAPAFVANADLLLNVSGACWLRPEYRNCPTTVYVDTDPGYTQQSVSEALSGRGDDALATKVDLISCHDFHATFAENIWDDGCPIPREPFRWIPTRQPIVLDLWPFRPHRGAANFTTVLSWQPYREQFRDVPAPPDKQGKLMAMLELPRSTGATMELAVSGSAPVDVFAHHGWRTRPAFSISHSPQAYRRYIARSAAEFSVAKDTYVETQSGWFSERTACYLASGRPAVVGNTGFSKRLPTGGGLHAFRGFDEARDGIQRVIQNHAHESLRARSIAEECFDAPKVLGRLLEAVKL
jgi:hypothetical protein